MGIKVWRDGLTYNIDPDPTKDITTYRMDWTEWLEEISAATTISSVDFNAATGLVVPSNQIDPSGKYIDFIVKTDVNNLPTVGDTLKLECVITAGSQSKPRSVYFKVKDL